MFFLNSCIGLIMGEINWQYCSCSVVLPTISFSCWPTALPYFLVQCCLIDAHRLFWLPADLSDEPIFRNAIRACTLGALVMS